MSIPATLGERIVLWTADDGQEVRLADIPYDVICEVIPGPNKDRKHLMMARLQHGTLPPTIARELGMSTNLLVCEAKECLGLLRDRRAELEPRVQRKERNGEPPFQVVVTRRGGGYVRAKTRPSHPRADVDGWYPLHRIVMENHLGRVLDESEIVHHRNGDKTDNDLGNLEVMSKSEHGKLHYELAGRPLEKVRTRCVNCHRLYVETAGHKRMRTKGTKTFCCLACRRAYDRSECPQ